MAKLKSSKEEIDTDWRYTPVPTLSKTYFVLKFRKCVDFLHISDGIFR